MFDNVFKLQELIEINSIYNIQQRISELNFINDKLEILNGIKTAIKNNNTEVLLLIQNKFGMKLLDEHYFYYACMLDNFDLANSSINRSYFFERFHFYDDKYINIAIKEKSKKVIKLLMKNNTKITIKTLKLAISYKNFEVLKQIEFSKFYRILWSDPCVAFINKKKLSKIEIYDLFYYAIKFKNIKAISFFLKNGIIVIRHAVEIAEDTNDKKIISLIYRHYNE